MKKLFSEIDLITIYILRRSNYVVNPAMNDRVFFYILSSDSEQAAAAAAAGTSELAAIASAV